ncbi:hypothetical protein V6N00_13160 [Tersicoccus sp. MR15.9]|uniref:hypothetical protein n=1 Tax=Tersicoccus mangrovi TaxID=3121635 RepID=UPI002FE60CEF
MATPNKKTSAATRSATTGRFVAKNEENRLAAARAYAKVAEKRGRSVPADIQRVIDRKAG